LTRKLATLQALDDAFDNTRAASIEVALESCFSILRREIPGWEFFVSALWPQFDPDQLIDEVDFSPRLFTSSDSITARARKTIDSIGEQPSRWETLHPSGSVLVPLRSHRGFLGWLGATQPAAEFPEDSPFVSEPSDIEDILIVCGQRLDSELDIYAMRLWRSAISTVVNHKLEDYFVERGIAAAANVLFVNGLCDAFYVCYDRAVMAGESDVFSLLHLPSETIEIPVEPTLDWSVLWTEADLPGPVRQRVGSDGHLCHRPLLRRDFEGGFRSFGRLYFIGHSFTTGTRLLFEDLANSFDSALVNYHEKRRELGRFLCPTLVRRLLQGDRKEIEEHLKPRQQWLALGFADIVGYSRLCSRYSDKPYETARLLKDWKTAMRDVVFRHNGIVDKFIGDCVFYLCGAWSSEPPTTLARDAVLIALECAEETARIGEHLADYGFDLADSLRLSVGIHAGDNLVVGEIGGEFTAIGADVNIAQRIQDHEFSSGQVVISDEVKTQLESKSPSLDDLASAVHLGPASVINLKGVGELPVYVVLSASSLQDPVRS